MVSFTYFEGGLLLILEKMDNRVKVVKIWAPYNKILCLQ
jgi:hypothetical protein